MCRGEYKQYPSRGFYFHNTYILKQHDMYEKINYACK